MPPAQPRKSSIAINNLYFWTATIHKWHNLLADDSMKMEIISSLQHLKKQGLINLFSYVIMPSHMHLIWQINGPNGKESPHGSLLKYTAHQFKKHLKMHDPGRLQSFRVDAANKQYEFWKRDSLAVLLFSRKVIFQKLDYIHNNPVAKHWRLAPSPEDYRFSSAPYYIYGLDEFGILTHISEVI
jgi:REP element-mobilizing transposase RayT